MNITIRNIPDEVMEKIRTLSKIERRSLNNEFLIVLEKGLETKSTAHEKSTKSIQIDLWRELSGKWEDDRSTGEIIEDIMNNRSMGRDVEL